MSNLIDYFIATPDEILDGNFAKSPTTRFPGILAKRADIVKLLRLQSIVDGVPIETHLKSLGTLAVPSPEEGPWIYRVPGPLVTSLAKASADEITHIGGQWAASEEWRLDQAPPDDVIQLVRDLSNLSRRARMEMKTVYLWICL